MNILTFDIEDWFIINDSQWVHHSSWKQLPSKVEVNVYTILGLLDKHDIKATFFILGWVAENFPELVKEISDKGHEIGYHSYYHVRPLKQTPEEFEDDLVKGLTLLETITGQAITKYRAPNLCINSQTTWVYPILAKHGIKISSSVRSHVMLKDKIINNHPVRIKTIDGTIMEFPLNRLDFSLLKLTYSGSGFFRIFPLSALEYLLRQSRYNMLYFHPRDFDHNVPKSCKLSPYRNWKQRVNAASTLPKLDRLMQQTVFTTISVAADTYRHMELPEIDLVPGYPFRKVG